MSQHPDPYGSPQSEYGNAKPKGSGSKMLLIILGIIGGLVVLSCGCCGGLWFMSVNVLNTAVQDAYGNHELVAEHLGEVQDMSPNLEQTGETHGGIVFDVQGSKADGQIIVYDQQGNQFGNAELHVNGDVYDLGPSG